MNKALVLTDKNFETTISNSDIPVLVEFWASWCPPCKMMEPILDELSEELSNKVKIVKINTDQNPSISKQYQIMSVPTIIIFDKGREVARSIGAQSKQQIINMFKRISVD